MNKYIKMFALAVTAAVSLQSCDSFLDLKPSSSVDSATAINDVQSATAALVGTYDGLQYYYSYGRDFVVYGDVLTNNVKASPTNSNRFTSEAAWSWSVSTADFGYYWNQTYNTINRANNIINAKISGDQTAVNQIVGEAYALRALLHFDLVRMYAQDYNFTTDHSHLGVPYITKHDAAGQPKRNTVNEVYTNILSDLGKAAELVTKMRQVAPYTLSPNAINGLYARVYLYMGNYAKAKEYAELVIPKYSLIPNDKYLASWGEEYTSESIFTLAHNAVDNQGTNALGYIYIEAGYGDLLVEPKFPNLYAEGDVRKGWFVNGKAASKKDNIYVEGKYPGRGTPGLDNYSMLRVSEMYLIAAESAARLGDEVTARKYLDVIRQRALPTAASTTATGQALIDAILLEKRKELAFEGHYFHDLKRLHLPIIAATTGTGALGQTIQPGDIRLAWPIPQREIDANPNIATQQNPGY